MNVKGPFNQFNNGVECSVKYENEWYRYYASPDDVEEHGRNIYNFIIENHKDEIIPENLEEKQIKELAFKKNIIIQTRNELLSASDWSQLHDIPAEIKKKYKKYRQDLRDITKQSDFPNNVVWPEKPK